MKQKRYLVIRMSSLGDVIKTIPTVAALRQARPDAYIAWLAERKYAAILKNLSLIDELIIFDKEKYFKNYLNPVLLLRGITHFITVIRKIRLSRFDVALDMHTLMKSGLFNWLSGAPKRCGFSQKNCREINALFSNFHAKELPLTMHYIEKNMCLLSEILHEKSIAEKWKEPFFISPVLNELKNDALEKLLHDEKIESGKYMVIHPWASLAAKEWPRRKVVSLADKCSEMYNCKMVILDDGKHQNEGRRIIELMNHKARLLTISDIDVLAVFLQGARLFIGMDSGISYLSWICNVPTITVFGPTDPVKVAPVYGIHYSIYPDEKCPVCIFKKCIKLDCIANISVDTVFSVVEKCLGRSHDQRTTRK